MTSNILGSGDPDVRVLLDVIDEPATEITYVGSDDNCGTLAAQDITIRLRGVPPFRLVWDYEEININADLTETSLTTTQTTQAIPLIINKADLTDEGGLVWSYTLEAGKSFTVQNNERTKYVYTLTELNGRIARKSDYLAGPSAPEDYSYYTNIVDLDAANGAQTSVEVIVNPSPATGTIYHIPNE